MNRLSSLEQRFTFLVEANLAIAATENEEDVRATVARFALGPLGDYCYVDLPAHRRANWRGSDIDRLALFQPSARSETMRNSSVELRCRYAPTSVTSHGTPRAMRMGLEEIVHTPDSTCLAQVAPDRHHRTLLEQLGPVSYLCVPLRARCEIVGAMGFVVGQGRAPHTEEDLWVARALASSAGLSLTGSPDGAVALSGETYNVSSIVEPRSRNGKVPPPLAPRQREALILLAEGLTTPQISEVMHITEGTAYKHVQRILKAFGAKTRAQAISKAINLGLIGDHHHS